MSCDEPNIRLIIQNSPENRPPTRKERRPPPRHPRQLRPGRRKPITAGPPDVHAPTQKPYISFWSLEPGISLEFGFRTFGISSIQHPASSLVEHRPILTSPAASHPFSLDFQADTHLVSGEQSETMKAKGIFLSIILSTCAVFNSLAATRYVNALNTHPAAPYNTWAKAATESTGTPRSFDVESLRA